MASSAAMKKVAEDFGYQLSFLKSDKELYSVFTKAVNGKWDASRFVAAVRGTKWYRTHGETYRQNQQLRYTDPKTFKDKLAQQRAAIATMAHQIGAPVPGTAMAKLAENALMMGWSEDQIRTQVASYASAKSTNGEAGSTLQALKQTAFRNGVNLSEGYYSGLVKQVALGAMTVENAQQAIRATYATKVAPGFEKELAGGQDLYDLASPYMQTMAKTLELNPGDIDLFDPTVRKALASSNDKDGQVGSIPLWQFESQLKKDPRWLKTNGARDELDKATRSLSQAFGVGV